jgi:NAD(P) transhydrogenase subunit alpha
MGATLMVYIYIFVLAIFIGFEIITKVPPLLHTPLMSGSNAISGITVVGALLVAGTGLQGENALLSKILGTAALVFATINVVGGFLVTDRMLEMFKREKKKPEEKG